VIPTTRIFHSFVQDRKNLLTFIVPFFFIATALFTEKITIKDRLTLLRVSLQFFVEFRQCLTDVQLKLKAENKSNKSQPCHPRKEKNTFVCRHFSEIDDSLCLCNLRYSPNSKREIDLIRLTTEFLEKTFGAISMRCRDKNVYERALNQLASLQEMRNSKTDEFAIRRRIKAEYIVLAPDFDRSPLGDRNPDRLALQLLHCIQFPYRQTGIQVCPDELQLYCSTLLNLCHSIEWNKKRPYCRSMMYP
jgi:hypothetical protein